MGGVFEGGEGRAIMPLCIRAAGGAGGDGGSQAVGAELKQVRCWHWGWW